jgi:hypothetical protein
LDKVMMPLVPRPFALWGSPLHQELCFELCRTIAAIWLGTARNAGFCGRAACHDGSRGKANVWRLLEAGGADCSPIKATSLAELSRAVRDCRSAGAA